MATGRDGAAAEGSGRSRREVAVRVAVMAAGVLLVGASVALSKHSLMGTTPISVIPAVVYDILKDQGVGFVTLGMCSFTMNFACLVVEVLLLRRAFPAAQLLQLPCVLVMSASVDLWAVLFEPIPQDSYAIQLLCVAVSVTILALGVHLETVADVVMTPGDALVSVIAHKTSRPYHRVKVVFDVSLVAVGVAVSLLYFSELRDVREGTVIAAVLTGVVIGVWTRLLSPLTAKVPRGRLGAVPPVVPAQDIDVEA